jgi:hypothetical protein
MKTMEDNIMVKFELFFKIALFGHMLKKKISAFTFWCMVIPLGPHLVHT